MITIRFFNFTLLVLSCAIVSAQSSTLHDYCSRVHYSFHSESSLSVKGSSNVTSFTCLNTKQLRGQEVILCGNDGNGYVEFFEARMNIPVTDLDCGGKGINSDFREMMQIERFPFITIDIHTLEKQSPGRAAVGRYIAMTTITMKGKTRPVRIPLTIQRRGLNSYHVEGGVHLQLSDFNIEPPRPMMGLVRVDDEVEIRFNLKLSYSL